MNIKNINLENINNINNEEATKTALIMPFLMELGYNVFNPNEVIPEYTADIAKKNGEKVDYAIKINDKVSILIEAKKINDDLSKHSKQLARYFVNTEAQIAILTNGIDYWFYTDLEKDNVMDNEPFFKINLLNITSEQECQLNDFTKENFDVNRLYGKAESLRIQKELAGIIVEQLREPTDEFIKATISEFYPGPKTQNVIAEYREHIKASYEQIMTAEMLKRMFPNQTMDIDFDIINSEANKDDEKKKEVETTDNELSIFHYIQTILNLNDVIGVDEIAYKDNLSYFNIIYDNKITKWIVRVYDKSVLKIVIYNGEENKTYELEHPIDIFNYESDIINAIKLRQ